MFEDKPKFNNSRFLPNSFRGIISGSSGCGKTYLLFDLLLNKDVFKQDYLDYNNLIICTTSNQKCYEVLEKCFNVGLPKNVINNIFQNSNEIMEKYPDINKLIEEIINDDDFISSEIGFKLVL